MIGNTNVEAVVTKIVDQLGQIGHDMNLIGYSRYYMIIKLIEYAIGTLLYACFVVGVIIAIIIGLMTVYIYAKEIVKEKKLKNEYKVAEIARENQLQLESEIREKESRIRYEMECEKYKLIQSEMNDKRFRGYQ